MVIAPTLKDGGDLAAAVCMLTPENGIALIDARGKKYAGVLMGHDRSGRPVIYHSTNYKNFQIKKHSK
jgi:hypothetical protein